MEINVNLATRPFIELQPILKWVRIGIKSLVVLCILLGTITYIVHQKAERARGRLRAVEEKISSIHRERLAYQEMLRRSENRRIRSEADSLNQLFDAKAFSWTLVMKDLESVLPDNLQVAAIEPAKAKDGSTTLHIRVLGPHDKGVEFLRNLELSKRFQSPRIIGESPDANEGPGRIQSSVSASKTTEFDLLAEYDADSRELAATSQRDTLSQKEEPNRTVTAKHAAQSHDSTLTGTSKVDESAVSKVLND